MTEAQLGRLTPGWPAGRRGGSRPFGKRVLWTEVRRVKRIFELGHGDVMGMTREILLQTIRLSEGRTVMAEVVVAVPPLVYGVSNAETAAAFGADMITLNGFDFDAPKVPGIECVAGRFGTAIKDVVGRILGVNLEPVPEGSGYPPGRTLSQDTLLRAADLGFDYVVITGNPGTGVTAEGVLSGVQLARWVTEGRLLIIAGKMHGAGNQNVLDPVVSAEFAAAGADVVLIPAPGTVPGMDAGLAREHMQAIHRAGALAMTATGTSQEGSSQSVIEHLALWSKMAGADIHHIGDAGFAGMAPPENIMALSIAIRGRRHTYRRMGYSMRK